MCEDKYYSLSDIQSPTGFSTIAIVTRNLELLMSYIALVS